MRRLLHPLYRHLESSVRPLRYLFIEITQRCNLRCRHCGSDCTRDSRFAELTTEEWLRFFAFLGERVDPRKMVLVITGGEPLCHPDLDRLLEGLAKNRLAFGLVSNGFALSEANVARLAQAGLSSMTISLDGLQASHDWLRGVPGSFARALSGIERAVSVGLPFFDVVTCVHPGNLPELAALADLLKERGVPAWRLFSIFPKGRARENRDLILSQEEFCRLLDFIRAERARQRQSGLSFSVQFSCEGYLPAALDRQVRDEPYFCRAGISIASVLCDGAISACPNLPRSLVQGNIRGDDLLQVWEQRFAPFRDRSWMRQGTCAACPEWSRCLGNSLHLWDEERRQPARCTWQCTRGMDSKFEG
jgi:radical SAM protein with 4Fe4S-binding SPASM domain